MSGSIEFYIRARDSAQSDSRTGTLATGPARIRIGTQTIDVGEDDALLIEIDELTGEGGDPPSRAIASVLAKQERKSPARSRARAGVQ